MMSLDAVGLFTKVPTDETLAAVQDKLAADPLLKEHTCIAKGTIVSCVYYQ